MMHLQKPTKIVGRSVVPQLLLQITQTVLLYCITGLNFKVIWDSKDAGHAMLLVVLEDYGYSGGL
jgi:hypothetical protein